MPKAASSLADPSFKRPRVDRGSAVPRQPPAKVPMLQLRKRQPAPLPTSPSTPQAEGDTVAQLKEENAKLHHKYSSLRLAVSTARETPAFPPLRVSAHVLVLDPASGRNSIEPVHDYTVTADTEEPCTPDPRGGSSSSVPVPSAEVALLSPGSKDAVKRDGSVSYCPLAVEAQEVIRYLDSAFCDGTFNHPSEKRQWLLARMSNLAKQAASLAKTDQCRRGAVLRLSSPLYVVGDIHGNFADLSFFMAKLCCMGEMQYTPHGFLFLGDFVDRGTWGVEVCAYIFALKCLAPQSVWMIRGNHDDPMVNGAMSEYKQFSFRYQCYSFCGAKERGDALFRLCNHVFRCLPLVAIVDRRIFCTHGGFPRYCGGDDDRMAVLEDPEFPDLAMVCPDENAVNPLEATLKQKQILYAWDVMWSDPIDKREEDEFGFASNDRGGSTITYSTKAVDTFFKRYNFELMVRAHQEKAAGSRLSNQGKVLTVFSTSGYCLHSNSAGVVLLGRDGVIRVVSKKEGKAVERPPASGVH